MSNDCKSKDDGCLTVILIVIALCILSAEIGKRFDKLEKKIDELSAPATAEMPE